MNTLLDRPWISCCTREDQDGDKQPPYLHECGCPSVNSIAKSEQKVVRICGHNEYAGFVSTPPKKYKKEVQTTTDYKSHRFSCCGDETKLTTRFDFVESRIFEMIYNPESDCFDPSGNLVSAGQISIIRPESETFICGPSADPVFDVCPAVTDGSIESATLKIHSTSGTTYIESGNCEGEIAREDLLEGTIVLEDEDTEADAIERANITHGKTSSSIWEVRTTTFEFVKRTADYALKATNLQIGANYVCRVRLERRPAIKNPSGSGYVDENGDPSEWTTTDDEDTEMIDEYTFTATDQEMVVPSTGELVGDLGENEVTPSIEIPQVQGWEYRIASTLIELALTNA